MATEGSPSPASAASPLGVLLRSWRERVLLTQEELARRTGLAVRTIRRLESGRVRQPHGESLRLLAAGLHLSGPERAELITTARSGPAAPVVAPR